MAVHELKTWPEYFQAIKSGIKTFEFRKNDRDYKVGDILYLTEFCPEERLYTGDRTIVQVTYILEGFMPELDGYAIMAIRPYRGVWLK